MLCLPIQLILTSVPLDYGFGDRHGVFAPLLGNGIFTQEGLAWKHSRELLRKQFVRMQYQNMDVFREHVDNLLASLNSSKRTIDLQPLFFKLTLDTTTALLLGRSVYSLRADEINDAGNKAFAENFDIAQGGLAKRFRLAPWHSLYSPPQFRRSCSKVHQFVDEYILERAVPKGKGNGQESSESFIDELAQVSNSKEMLRDQLLNILLAGRDTTDASRPTPQHTTRRARYYSLLSILDNVSGLVIHSNLET